MFCTNCGARLGAGARFCTYCGTAVAAPQQQWQGNCPPPQPPGLPRFRPGCCLPSPGFPFAGMNGVGLFFLLSGS